jgi:hypothetical protein
MRMDLADTGLGAGGLSIHNPLYGSTVQVAVPSWYHGLLSPAEAELRLKQEHEDGAFLVTGSDTSGSHFLLYALSQGEVHSVPLRYIAARKLQVNGGESLPGASLVDGVAWMLSHPNLAPLRLSYGVSRADDGGAEDILYHDMGGAYHHLHAAQAPASPEKAMYAHLGATTVCW